MKSYTDIEQSKKLAEILPLEGADMCYIKHSSSNNPTWRFDNDMPPMILGSVPIDEITAETLPCWSLAALLDVLPVGTESHKQSDGSISYYYVEVYNNRESFSTKRYDNLIDACYEMVLKLHELKML